MNINNLTGEEAYSLGRIEERASIIAHVAKTIQEMKASHTAKLRFNDLDYNAALDDLLAHLRQSDAPQGVCEVCEWRSSEIGYSSKCPAHAPQGDSVEGV